MDTVECVDVDKLFYDIEAISNKNTHSTHNYGTLPDEELLSIFRTNTYDTLPDEKLLSTIDYSSNDTQTVHSEANDYSWDLRNTYFAETPDYCINTDLCDIDDASTTLDDLTTAQRTRDDIYLTTDEGRHHWSPLLLNAESNNLEAFNYRSDISREYNNCILDGSIHHVHAGFSVDCDSNEGLGNQSAVRIPVNVFAKIKVFSTVFCLENISRSIMTTSSFAIQRRDSHNASNCFLQEVVRFNSPVGTLARYKYFDVSNTGHAYHKSTDGLYIANLNMCCGRNHMILLLHLHAAKYRCLNRNSRLVPLLNFTVLNNTSITLDSVISSVEDESKLKSTLCSKSCPIKVLRKNQFRTHKITLTSRKCIDNLDPANCTCNQCVKAELIQQQLKTLTTQKNDLTKWCTADEAKKIQPLIDSYEAQMHSRCLNVSGVLEQRLLPGACDFGKKLLLCDPHVKIDIALVCCKSFLEVKSMSLITELANHFCEVLCWRRKTRFMTKLQQYNTFVNELKPLLSRLYISRFNFAHATTFSYTGVKGCKIFKCSDNLLVSHKYKNQQTIAIFKNNTMKSPTKRTLLSYPRRTRGIVWPSHF